MSEIIKGISNLFASIFQVLEGTIKTIVNTIIGAISTVLDVIIGLFKSLFSLAEGVVGLVIGKYTMFQNENRGRKRVSCQKEKSRADKTF